MNDKDISDDQVAAITRYVDIEALPPDKPTGHIIFGTNQAPPADIAASRYHQGLAPMIIATGGVNRHNRIVEGREFRRQLIDRGVPDAVVRVEDRSANTWQNVEFGLPYLQEAVESGLAVTAICKWYHRRAVHVLRTLMPDLDLLYVITWEPIYAGSPVTRTNWSLIPEGRRRVLREWEEVPRRIADGSFLEATRVDGAWR